MKNKRNSEKSIFLFLSILAVVAVSGCVIPGGDVFAGMFSPQRPATTEGSADLITVQNTNIIPNPPISADNGFTVSFEVKNNDENEEVKNVAVNYYDYGLCKPGKTTTPSGESTVGGIVADEIDVWVAHFSTTCNGKTTNIHLTNRNDQNAAGYQFSATDQKLCDSGADENCETAKCQVTVIDKDKVYFKIGNQAEVTFTTTDKTKTYDGKTITFNGATSVKKSKCVSAASCERTPGDADAACKKLGSIYFVSDISDTTYCYPWYGNVGFTGYCYKCDYTSTTLPDSSTPSKAGAKTYYPLQTELAEWDFTAPSNSQIGNMPQTCGIKYKITYDFTAKTQTDVTVISKSKMAELQRAGQEPSASPSQSVGVGPIKIFFDFGAKQPIKSGDVLPVFITIEDKGSGVYGKVLSGKLKIKMPSGFELATPDSCSKFGKSGGVFTNSAEIPMIKKSSPQLRCSFKMPSVADMKTFYITGELAYEYKFDDEIKVSINPTLVR